MLTTTLSFEYCTMAAMMADGIVFDALAGERKFDETLQEIANSDLELDRVSYASYVVVERADEKLTMETLPLNAPLAGTKKLKYFFNLTVRSPAEYAEDLAALPERSSWTDIIQNAANKLKDEGIRGFDTLIDIFKPRQAYPQGVYVHMLVQPPESPGDSLRILKYIALPVAQADFRSYADVGGCLKVFPWRNTGYAVPKAIIKMLQGVRGHHISFWRLVSKTAPALNRKGVTTMAAGTRARMS